MSPRRFSSPDTSSLIVDFPTQRRRSTESNTLLAKLQNLKCADRAETQDRARAQPIEQNIPEISPRQITFSTKNHVRYIEKPSPEEIDNRWFNKKDKKRFKKSIMNDTRRMSEVLASTTGEGISSCDLNACVGIEIFLSPGLAKRAKDKRVLHCNVILQEIARQEEMGISDDRRIRKLSERSSKWSRERAHDLAVGYYEILDEE